MFMRNAVNRDEVLEDIKSNWEGVEIRSAKVNWNDPYYMFKKKYTFGDGTSKDYHVGSDYCPLVYILWEKSFWSWTMLRNGKSERPTQRMRTYKNNNPYREYNIEIVEEATHIDYIQFPKLRDELSKHPYYGSPERHAAYQNLMKEVYGLERHLIWNYHPKYNILDRDPSKLCKWTDPKHTLEHYGGM